MSSEPGPGVRTVEPPRAGATRVVLIRHGASVAAALGVVGGRRGCRGLTDEGRAQAAALAARLVAGGELADATALYASTLPRAVETAALIAPGVGRHPVIEDGALCELLPGAVDGRRWDEIAVALPTRDRDPHAPFAPGGESWAGFVDRAAAAVAAVAARHAGRLVVVVCHAGVVEATMLRFGAMGPPTARLGLPTVPTSITEWEQSGPRWRLMRYNDAAHLVGARPGPAGGRVDPPVVQQA